MEPTPPQKSRLWVVLALLLLILAGAVGAYMYFKPDVAELTKFVPAKLWGKEELSAPEALEEEVTPPPLADEIRAGTAAPPKLTTTIEARLAESEGFAALISYTSIGFEPSSVTIEAGETVRFANNSSAALMLVIDGESTEVQSQHFSEQTFDTAGSYVFSTGSHTGEVRVE